MLIVEGDLTPNMVKSMCLLSEDPLILEIGAHHGEDSKAFLDAFPNCRLHAFEADPRCLAELRRALGHDRRCMIHACAVADKSGFMPWYQSGGTPDGKRLDWDYSSSLLKPSGHLSVYPWCTFDSKINVQAVALDKLRFADVDFIWMDVQGAEHLVLEGAIETLSRTRYLYTQYYDRPLYEGQKNLEAIRQMLPNFDVVALFTRAECRNVLFEQKSLTRSPAARDSVPAANVPAGDVDGVRPMLSAIVPTFDSGGSLAACFAGFEQQTARNFEVIIADGGSTDSTLRIVKEFSGGAIPVRAFSERDKGTYDAINKAIRLARGQWIYVCGSDDALADDRVVEDVLTMLAATAAWVVYGNVRVRGDAGWARDGELYDGEFDLAKLAEKNICQQAVFYRKALFDSIGYFDLAYPICADWDLMLRAAAQKPVRYIDRVIADFRGGGKSGTRRDLAFERDRAGKLRRYFGTREAKGPLGSGDEG